MRIGKIDVKLRSVQLDGAQQRRQHLSMENKPAPHPQLDTIHILQWNSYQLGISLVMI